MHTQDHVPQEIDQIDRADYAALLVRCTVDIGEILERWEEKRVELDHAIARVENARRGHAE